jgi:predicted nucleic acid-binding protein
VQAADVGLGLSLFETHARLTARDAMFAAVALNRGVDAILSADQDFDGIPGIERIDPRDGDAVAQLYADA